MYTPEIKESQYLSAYCNKKVYTLDFSDSPCGTHKYLRSQKIIEEVIKNNYDRICLITAGNAGYALLQEVEKINAVREKKIFLSFVIDKNISEKRVATLQSPYVTIIRKNLDEKFLTSTELIELSKVNEDEEVFDATKFMFVDVSQIVDQLKEYTLDTALLPVGSGEFYLSLWSEIKRVHSGMKLIGVVPKDGHPLCARSLDSLEDFYSSYVFNTLTPSISFSLLPNNVRNLLLQTIHEGCSLVDADNENIKKAHELSKQAGYDVEASSAIPLSQLQNEALQGKNRILCIFTGRSRE